jgi:2-keto-4-pentenoate hydratase/2-oxohepta-3-ene-1,7-dioic acid hydratase in catechol pathway
MKLVTYIDDAGTERIGALFDGETKVADLAAAAEAVSPGSAHPFATMLTLIDGGESALAQAVKILQSVAAGKLPNAAVDLDEIQQRSPVPVPRQIRACIAFEDHLLNAHKVRYRRLADAAPDPEAAWNKFVEEGAIALNSVWYERALYYMTNRFSVIGPDEDIRCPKHSGRIDYELEFGIFIGKEGRDIGLDQAKDHIFGYSIFNDISAREIQHQEMPGGVGPHKGKNFDTGNVIGPWIVTPDEIPDIAASWMVARVNGTEFSRGKCGDMYHDFSAIIADISRDETLYPGEFIASGTVGTGSGLEYDRYLADGDIIELEIDGLGILRNKFVAA